MAEHDATLRRLQRLAQRLRDADLKADAIRAQLREELQQARNAGVSVSAIARALDVSRQRIQQMLKR
jgi:polysaccharide deacetylase 2 family uncharacterized protein YibQ